MPKILIDAKAAARFDEVHAAQGRRYYITKEQDARMMLIRTDGVALYDCINEVVDAQIGWHEGKYGYVPEHLAGYRWSKLTIRRILRNAVADELLSAVLSRAPRRSAR